jgi:hypothetical protein
MHRIVALIAVVVALAALPAVASAQDNPFLPPAQQQQQAPAQPLDQPPPPAPVEDRDDGDGLSPTVAVAIGIITILLIGGIWFAITRDARSVTKERKRTHTARTEPDAFERATPGSRGRHHTRATTRRKPSKQEQKRRKRGRAR